MKKILALVFIILLNVAPSFADVIYHNNVAVIEGKIDGMVEGLINIKSMGNLFTIVRKEPSPVFKDVVIAKRRLLSTKTMRYSGTVMFVDNMEVKILCEDTKVIIPRYRVKNIDIYVP